MKRDLTWIRGQNSDKVTFKMQTTQAKKKSAFWAKHIACKNALKRK